jgi:o-succinylbenzoate synthase
LRLSQRAARRELPRPAANAHRIWLVRDACIITLESDEGVHGSGEAAPLPGFSSDTLAACEHALRAFDASGIPERLGPEHSLLSELARASTQLPASLPAARAALEAALLDLWARAARVPAWRLFSTAATPPTSRRVAALLLGEPEEALEQARAARTRGINTFKIKVGRPAAVERELTALEALRAELGPHATLRLDANGAWSNAEALAHLPRFARSGPELIEEPCAHSGLAALVPSAVPLALDESLRELTPDPSVAAKLAAWGVRALILKPTLLGGVTGSAAWAKVARQCGAQVILSHAFDGPLGLGLAATLALALGSEHAAHGLDLAGAQLARERATCFVDGEIRAWAEPGLPYIGGAP